MSNKRWTQKEALALCVEMESICQSSQCHVALSGGCLYKKGERKDCDLIFYRIRQSKVINQTSLIESILLLGFKLLWGGGFCFKFERDGKRIDCLFPEEYRVDKYTEPKEKFIDPDGEDNNYQ